LDNILSVMGKFSVNKLPSDILKSTASNTAALRKELKLTQADLSVKSGVSYGSIKRFERTGRISFESLLKIAEALDRLSDFEELLIPKGNKKVEDLFKTLQ
jgi:transcriptional regulator with XRE-family HTH domain